MHLYLDLPVAFASLAPAPANVEAETPGPVPMRLAVLGRCEKRANIVPEPYICCRVAARRSANRRLVDVDDLVDLLDTGKLAKCAAALMGPIDAVRQCRGKRVGHQGAFAATRYPRHDREGAEGDLDGDVLQVVLACTGDFKRPPPRGASMVGNGDAFAAGQVIGRQRPLRARDLGGRPARDDGPASLARPRPHIDDVVRCANGVLVMLDDDDGVA